MQAMSHQGKTLKRCPNPTRKCAHGATTPLTTQSAHAKYKPAQKPDNPAPAKNMHSMRNQPNHKHALQTLPNPLQTAASPNPMANRTTTHRSTQTSPQNPPRHQNQQHLPTANKPGSPTTTQRPTTTPTQHPHRANRPNQQTQHPGNTGTHQHSPNPPPSPTTSHRAEPAHPKRPTPDRPTRRKTIHRRMRMRATAIQQPKQPNNPMPMRPNPQHRSQNQATRKHVPRHTANPPRSTSHNPRPYQSQTRPKMGRTRPNTKRHHRTSTIRRHTRPSCLTNPQTCRNIKP